MTMKNLRFLRPTWLAGAIAILFLGGYYRLFITDMPRVLDKPGYVVYVPSGWAAHQPRPLVIALSPNGDAMQMLQTWRGVADEFKWIILASKKFRNGVDGSPFYDEIYHLVIQGQLGCPVDLNRVLVTGLSGGGMGSHQFAFRYPDFITAVVINTGMMAADYYYPLKDQYPKKKIAVFLSSPTDFRYHEMQSDQRFLEDLDWRTQWIEFEGGHRLAPPDAYKKAARWVQQQWQ
jgi:predicted esterase